MLAAAATLAGCAATGPGGGSAGTATASTAAAASDPGYTPTRGQSGKDVVWIPTPDRLVSRMLQLAQTRGSDYVVDLGAGDGKIVIAAAREYRARGLGLEYNPNMVGVAQRNAARAGVADLARFRQADIFESDFSAATVVTMYLLPHLNLRLRATLMAMKPGTRLVSHQWTMGNWPADETTWVVASPLYLWIVPANAGGTWQLRYPQGDTMVTTELKATQQFQRITEASVDVAGLKNTLRASRIDGDRFRFEFTDATGRLRAFDGRIAGDRISGMVTDAGAAADGGAPSVRGAPFTAVRVGPAPPIGGSEGYSEEESMRVGAEIGG